MPKYVAYVACDVTCKRVLEIEASDDADALVKLKDLHTNGELFDGVEPDYDTSVDLMVRSFKQEGTTKRLLEDCLVEYSNEWDQIGVDFDVYALSCDDPDCECRRSPDWPDNIKDGCPNGEGV